MCEPYEDLLRAEFEKIFPPAELADFLDFVGVSFGDLRHDWCPRVARELLEEWRGDATEGQQDD